MQHNLLRPKQALNKAYVRLKTGRTEIEHFKSCLRTLVDSLNLDETEEHAKNVLRDFLRTAFYTNYGINTKGKTDLVIQNCAGTKSPVGVVWVNTIRVQQGTFAYTFHFYALLLMGIVFLALSALQLHCVSQISRGNSYYRSQLNVYCLSLAILSFPLFPLNPIGLLPVITSLSILITVAATRKQWRSNKLQQTYRPRTAVTA